MTRVQPQLQDGYGYFVCHSDLEFLGLTRDDLSECFMRRRPLGTSVEFFDNFVTKLDVALKKDGIRKADVRLQGSAAKFFSGDHKRMPWTDDDIINEFLANRRRYPEAVEKRAIIKKMNELWPAGSQRPTLRQFDVIHRLGISREKSDYDVQISSDEIVELIRTKIRSLGGTISERTLRNPDYHCLNKKDTFPLIPNISDWAALQTDILDRPVKVAVFDSAGPPAVVGPLSSHFREDDWCLIVGTAA